MRPSPWPKDAGWRPRLCKVDLDHGHGPRIPLPPGKAGGLYSRAEGFPRPRPGPSTSNYQPVRPGGRTSGIAGGRLVLGPTSDTIVGVVGGWYPGRPGRRGSLGLRRNAQGVCKIILDRRLALSFPGWWTRSWPPMATRSSAQASSLLYHPSSSPAASATSMKTGYRYDSSNARPGRRDREHPQTLLRLKALDALKASPHFEPFILMAKRCQQHRRRPIPSKVDPGLSPRRPRRISTHLLHHQEQIPRPWLAQGHFVQAQKWFSASSLFWIFFEQVMVMAKESKLRKPGSPALGIKKILDPMADYSQVVVEGERPRKGMTPGPGIRWRTCCPGRPCPRDDGRLVQKLLFVSDDLDPRPGIVHPFLFPKG